MKQIDPHRQRKVTLRLSEIQIRTLGGLVLNHLDRLNNDRELKRVSRRSGFYPSLKAEQKDCSLLFKKVESLYKEGELKRPYVKERLRRKNFTIEDLALGLKKCGCVLGAPATDICTLKTTYIVYRKNASDMYLTRQQIIKYIRKNGVKL